MVLLKDKTWKLVWQEKFTNITTYRKQMHAHMHPYTHRVE